MDGLVIGTGNSADKGSPAPKRRFVETLQSDLACPVLLRKNISLKATGKSLLLASPAGMLEQILQDPELRQRQIELVAAPEPLRQPLIDPQA